jgi:hypothetical protein
LLPTVTWLNIGPSFNGLTPQDAAGA